MNRKQIGTIAFTLVVLFAEGCAPTDRKLNLPPEEAVGLRAQAWADALLAGDLEGAYELTSPNYRQVASIGQYHARVQGTGVWDKADVSSVSCEEQVCTVKLSVEYSSRSRDMTIQRPREYKWVKGGGQWWLYVSAK